MIPEPVESTDVLNEYVMANLLVDDISDNLIAEIEVLLSKLLFLLAKISTRKARKLKRFLSSLTVMGIGS